jgi:hypothetical protein
VYLRSSESISTRYMYHATYASTFRPYVSRFMNYDPSVVSINDKQLRADLRVFVRPREAVLKGRLPGDGRLCSNVMPSLSHSKDSKKHDSEPTTI